MFFRHLSCEEMVDERRDLGVIMLIVSKLFLNKSTHQKVDDPVCTSRLDDSLLN